MSDKEQIAEWGKINDPIVALETLLENEMYFGYDPYYRDLREALLAMAERCAKTGVGTGA